ncbi:polyketide cyclase [Elstera cyanobacteriorum]|uniref:SnoaL-like domain-containing protein n=1 Tax=Elstera cyanobacteriorum TaxID=2022747 RepID=A0A255XQK4_9PROT|nr:nuclear transport factor 2 family protein [Elstera cyanobacteriorum]OYQ18634.1 hypothetical protein CHR90_10215 [Elstera cyanobacteriorum]GFZ78916.1 polyketide cyclase [Elstera cyanobacteriorum]
MTSITLPPAVAAYLSANNAGNAEIAALQFTATACVKDDGQDIRGRTAIQVWKQMALDRYSATITPKGLLSVDGSVLLTALVSGNFPGSPIDLTFRFGLVDGLIDRLEIGQ